MSIEYTISRQLVVVTAYGPFTMDEVFLTFGRIMVDPTLKPPANVLLDARHTDYGPPNEEIEAIAEHLGGLKAYFGGRWAVVAKPDTLLYHLSRMFCRMAEPHGLTVEPFSDYDAACLWLLQPHT
jgi:hypothetical protein